MNEILVTVIVVTYNSAKYVEETLNSIKCQDYNNIELIISDDGSKDETIRICEQWLSENSEKFIATKLLTVEKNTGTSANCNRGIRYARGNWIKIIAGDDKLLQGSISTYVSYVKEHKNVDFVFSKVLPFGDVAPGTFCDFFKDTKKCFERLTKTEFKIALLKTDFLPASSAFLKRETLARLGGFNEAIPLIEDWPLWVKGIFEGCKFCWIDVPLVGYRYSQTSVSQNLSPKFLDSQCKAIKYNLSYATRIGWFFWVREYINYMAKYDSSFIWSLTRLLRFINPYTFVLYRISLKLKK